MLGKVSPSERACPARLSIPAPVRYSCRCRGTAISGDHAFLREAIRDEKDPEVKKVIVEMLAASGSKEAVAYLMELIDE